MKKTALIFTAAVALSLLVAGSAGAFNVQTGQLNPDWTPWPSITNPPVVEFETRIGNQATNGDWELGHKFNGSYLDTSGQFAFVSDTNYNFTLTHNSTNGTFTLSLPGGVSTTWTSGRPCQKVKEIWLLAKSSLDYGSAKLKNMTLDNGSGPVAVTWDKPSTLSATNNNKYLLIDGEQLENFTLAGEANFTWTSGSPSGSQLELMVSVVFADNQDNDNDGIGNQCDNCPTVPNTDQADCNTNGVGDVCDAINPGATEICDNVDNNCNGSTDENLTQPTSCGVGACGSNGFETCTAGVWGNNTCTPGTPVAETCDNIDNDCDGSIDENLTQPTACGVGACGSNGIETCTAGVWGNNTCTPGAPVTETCNNIDDDCDGSVDENLTQQTTCGVGACAGNTGEETCTAGVWGGDTCDPLAGATAETCDNADNDCDGSIDENLTQQTTCGLGACAGNTGVETCTAGVWGGDTCDPLAGATVEVCDQNQNGNDIDEDCDGVVDNVDASNAFVQLISTGEYYCYIADAYDLATTQDSIKLKSMELGSPVFDLSKEVTLKGGYDTGFSGQASSGSIITPDLTISGGTIIAEYITIKN